MLTLQKQGSLFSFRLSSRLLYILWENFSFPEPLEGMSMEDNYPILHDPDC